MSLAGLEVTVNFKDNAAASTAPPAPAPGAPGAPGAPPGAPTAPGMPLVPNAGQVPPGINPGFRPTFPQRIIRGNEPAPGQPGAAMDSSLRATAGRV